MTNPESMREALQWIAAVLSDCTACEKRPSTEETRDMLETAREALKS